MAPQILALAAFLSITWGAALVGSVYNYKQTMSNPRRSRKDIVVAVRTFVGILCAWLFVFSFVFRTAAVLMGLGDDVVGQAVFYALVGSNVTGSIFVAVSFWFD